MADSYVFICVLVYTFPIFCGGDVVFLILKIFSVNYLLSFSLWITYRLIEEKIDIKIKYKMREENVHKYRQNSKHINYFTESYKRKTNIVEIYNFPKWKIYSGSGKIAKKFKYK